MSTQRGIGSRLRKTRARLHEPVVDQQRTIVAAICFRRRGGHPIFRLVPDGDGERWGFPECEQRPSETLAQTAVRAASANAGATGVVGDKPLSDYAHPLRPEEPAVAFLLAVQSIAPSARPDRHPAWFDLATTRERLAAGRGGAAARELQRLLDVAEHELEDRRRHQLDSEPPGQPEATRAAAARSST